MANTFKNSFKKNLSTSAPGTVVVSSDNVVKILIGLQLTNTGSSEVKSTVSLFDHSVTGSYDSGDEMVLLNLLAVPPNSMVSVLVGDKIVFEANDFLSVQSDTSSALNAFASYLEIT